MLSLDISRESFQRSKNFSGLRQQQGRVPLESELNEASDIAAEELRRTIQDVICNSGTPDDGFRVSFADDTPEEYDFTLAQGTYYIGGRRYDCYAGTTFLNQPDWLQLPHDAAPLPEVPASERFDFVYLEGGQQFVSATEDSELFERALGGADGAGRMRRWGRVHVVTDSAETCAEAMDALYPDDSIDPDTMAIDTGAGLTVGFDPDYVETNLCKPEVQGGYQGAENETIRVQLTAPDRYIYGRDNASHLYRVTLEADGDETIVTFITLPRDAHSQPLALQTAEVLRWTATLPNGEHLAEQSGRLANILSDFDPEHDTMRIALDLTTLTAEWGEGGDDTYYYLRIWTGDPESDAVDYPITGIGENVLNGTGLTAAFRQAPDGDYGMAGDFWVIAARPNAPDVVTPWQLIDVGAGTPPPPAPPAGPLRHVAPLAIIHWTPEPGGQMQANVHDCRERFRKLCKVPTCCEVTVGDGEHSHGDVSSIAAALARLPVSGGKICLLRGTFTESVVMAGRRNISFCGCGDETVWQAGEAGPTLTMTDCHNISFNHFRMSAEGEDIILAGNRSGPTPLDDTCSHLSFDRMIFWGRDRSALWLNDCNDMIMKGCRVMMRGLSVARSVDETMGVDPAIFVMGDRLHLEHNHIGLDPDDMPPTESRPLGGLQIGGLSEDVTLRDNLIDGGKGNAVTLGHIEWLPLSGTADGTAYWTMGTTWYINEAGCFVPSITLTPPTGADPGQEPQSGGEIRNLRIENNRIRDMGLNGIAVCHFFDLSQDSAMITLSDTRITGNDITGCLTSDLDAPPDALSFFRSFGGIVLANCDLLQISGNRIQDNGVNVTAPMCGVFILLGSGLRIDDNHIFANGDYGLEPVGRYGGVNIGWCLTHVDPEPDRTARATPARRLALSMSGNFIDSPNGQALKVNAIGPVSITGNQMIGTARNVLDILRTIGIILAVLPPATSLATILTSLVITREVDRDSFASPNMLLAELLIMAMGGSAVSVFNAAWLEEMIFLVASQGNLPGYLDARGGETMFDNNQVTLLPAPTGPTNPVSSVLVASMDDVSLSNNQIEIDGGVGFALINAFAPAGTVRMNSNRLQETPLQCLFSGFSHSVFINTQGLNQGTHCFAATALGGLGPRFVERPSNLSFIDAMVGGDGFCALPLRFLSGILGNFGSGSVTAGGGNTGGGDTGEEPPTVLVPDLQCEKREDALVLLEDRKLDIEVVEVNVSGASPPYIVRQEPPANTSLPEGSKVTVYLATDLPGQPESDADQQIYKECVVKNAGGETDGGGPTEGDPRDPKIKGEALKADYALGGIVTANTTRHHKLR
ncbi:MAG: right-handed parallel beta-helix repeat-containing protein [Sulfitobacter sp.]